MQLTDEAKAAQRATEGKLRDVRRELDRLERNLSSFERLTKNTYRQVASADSLKELDVRDDEFFAVLDDLQDRVQSARSLLDDAEREANKDATTAKEYASTLAEKRTALGKVSASLSRAKLEVERAAETTKRNLITAENKMLDDNTGKFLWRMFTRPVSLAWYGILTALSVAAGAVHIAKK